jgi:predicted GNAT family acetyltransferase
MTVVSLHSKDQIAAVLRRRPQLHLYALGDLDDIFWPHTVWYGLQEQGEIREIVLLYTAFDTPILLGITENPAAMNTLVRAILRLLPRRIYAHLSSGVLEAMHEDYAVEDHGQHYKMGLVHPDHYKRVDTSAVIPLTSADADELTALYKISNPDAWFDSRLLETGCYYGIRISGRLVSVAGIHVYSPVYRAAALGNVVTHPDFRGRGFAKAACARLCQSLSKRIDTIGLNVLTTNAAALRCYDQLGFEPVGIYGEYMLELKR